MRLGNIQRRDTKNESKEQKRITGKARKEQLEPSIRPGAVPQGPYEEELSKAGEVVCFLEPCLICMSRTAWTPVVSLDSCSRKPCFVPRNASSWV